MKNMKKILALVVAVLMIAASVSALAAPTDTTLKVSPVDGHKYTAYQLFVGDLAADGKTLSNVKWGTNVAASITYKAKADASATTYTVDKTISPIAGDPVPQEVLDYLASLSTKTAADVAQGTADIISAWVTGDGTVIDETNGITVKTGYYVVKDEYEDASAAQTTTLSTMMCEVVGPTTLTPKAGTTEHKKEVLDINDTTDTALDLTKLKDVASGWDKSADHDFGDHVPFKLTTTIASDFAKYDSYYLAVSDTMYDGLKLDANSIEVYVDGEKATQGTEAGQYALTTDEQTFKVEFTKLNGNAKAAAGKEVVVIYTATLDKDSAVIGGTGNINESFAEFSNNPNGDQQGKGKTPTSTAVVFTYKTVVNKKDENGTDPLKGAEFTLTKTVKDSDPVAVAVLRFDSTGKAVATASTAGTAADGTTFSFNGLDDGTYTLTETVTPNGYNTIDPVTFQVVATHDANGVKTLEVKNADGSAFDGTLTFTTSTTEGSINTDVINKKGTTLPSTGGMGTTILYVGGSILVILAAVLLITKRRMNAND